jgi:hypothetical protein
VKFHRQMIECIDRMEAQRVRQGTRKFQALRARTSKPSPKP